MEIEETKKLLLSCDWAEKEEVEHEQGVIVRGRGRGGMAGFSQIGSRVVKDRKRGRGKKIGKKRERDKWSGGDTSWGKFFPP